MASVIPQYHPIEMIEVIAGLIDGYVEDAAALLPDIRTAVIKPHVLDGETVNRIEIMYLETADLVAIFEEQLRRWGESSLTSDQRAEVARLYRQLSELRPMVEEILTSLEQIRPKTIDRVMAKSDLELGLDVLLGKGRR
jgi:hypothetical protein